jgi:hypothetical protein
MVDASPPESRLERGLAAAQGRATAAWLRVRGALQNPVRLLIGATMVVLVVLSVPLLVGSAARLDRIWNDWRHDATVSRNWTPTIATIRAVRAADGLDLDLAYWDGGGERHRAEVHIEAPGTQWVRSTLPIRYDPHHPSRVDVVGVTNSRPIGHALATGAALGAGVAAAMLAFAIWRRRSVLAVADRPLHVLRRSLALSGAVLTIGIAAWGVGTVTTQGWTSIADSIGVQASDLFRDFMVVIVPAVAFGAGALASAWLARHRHHERHDGMLSSAHRLIDRASEYMPSPEQIRAEQEHDATPGAGSNSGSGGSPHAA